MGRRRAAAAGAALCLLLGGPAAAGESPEPLRLGGSVRTLAAGTFNYDSPLLFGDHEVDGISRTVLRVTATGKPTAALSYEVHAVQTVTLESFFAAADGAPWSAATAGPSRRWTATDGAWEQTAGEDGRADLLVDRANFRIAMPRADLTVGRQAVNFGSAWFWNPLDIFMPVDPRAVDRDHRAGVDAVRLDAAIGALSGVTVAAVAGRGRDGGSVSRDGSSLVARLFACGRIGEAALQAGKVPGGWQAGGSLAGEAAGSLFRAEAARTWGDRSAAEPAYGHWSATASLSRRLSPAVSVEAAYLYNGAGDPDDPGGTSARVLDGTNPQLSRQLTGAIAWLQLRPLIRATASWLHSLSDGSDLLHAGLTISLSGEADLLLGAFVPRGARPEGLVPRTEFGSYPGLAYLELKRSF